MKRLPVFFRILCVLTCACFFWAGIRVDAAPDDLFPDTPSLELPACGSDPIPPCETPEQLQELLEQNDGGTITLTGDIVWDQYGYLSADSPTVIEMGDYSIVVQDDSLSLGEHLSFVGSGSSKPLFWVKEEASFNCVGSSIVSNGEYATTIYVEQNTYFFLSDAQVGAMGTGATALWSEGSLDLMGITVQSSGESGICIHAAEEVRVFYSSISAAGTAIVSDAGEILLDCAVVTPLPENARVIERQAVLSFHNMLYGICVEPGEELWLPESVYYTLYNTKDENDVILLSDVPVLWGGEPYDTNMLGEYRLYFVPQPKVPIKGIDRMDVSLYVVDPVMPWLLRVAGSFPDIYLEYFRLIEDYDSISLRYSVDEGRTWADAAADLNAGIYDYYASVDGLDSEKTYLFRLEVVGGPMEGTSNILKVWDYVAESIGGERDGNDRGGNRDGNDREDESELPPVTKVPESSGSARKTKGGTTKPDESPATADSGGASLEEGPVIREPAPGAGPVIRETAPGAERLRDVPVSAAVPPPVSYPRGSQVYSARELADLMSANPQRLVFLFGGMKAVIPTEALTEVLPPETDFAIYMDQPEETRFRIRMFAGNAELDDLDGKEFQAHIPVDGEDGELVCADITGENASVSKIDGMAVCTLVRTGEYVISKIQKEVSAATPFVLPEEDQTPQSSLPQPIPPGDARWILLFCVGGAVIVIVVAAWAVVRRRRVMCRNE